MSVVELKFDAETHSYTIDGSPAKGVSKFFHEFEEEFNAKKIAPFSAKKLGITVEEVLEMWEIKKTIGISYGNMLHFTIEGWGKYGMEPIRPYLVFILDEYKKMIQPYIDEGWDIVYEDQIANKEYMLAGTRDLVLRKDNKFKIIDFKTDFDLHNKIKPVRGYFKAPLQNYKASRLNAYRVKMSIYKHLEELTGAEFDGLELWHWEDGFTVHKLKPVDVTPLFEIRKKQLEW